MVPLILGNLRLKVREKLPEQACAGTHEGFPRLRYLFGGPQNKDHNIMGSILGSPFLWKLSLKNLRFRDYDFGIVESQLTKKWKGG